MNKIAFKSGLHYLGESRYAMHRTLSTAHGGVVTPLNRATIPRRYVPYREVPMLRAQDAQEQPLPCTPENVHCTASN